MLVGDCCVSGDVPRAAAFFVAASALGVADGTLQVAACTMLLRHFEQRRIEAAFSAKVPPARFELAIS